MTKDEIISVARSMFAEQKWGFGVLGNCGEHFATELRQQLTPLWSDALKKAEAVHDGRTT